MVRSNSYPTQEDHSLGAARGAPGWWVRDRATVVGSLPGRRQACSQLLKVPRKGSQLLVRHFLKANHARPGPRNGADELIQLQLNRPGIPVLGILDHEDHEEGDDRGGGVDDELPCVGEVKMGSHGGPDDNDEARDQEHLSRPDDVRATACEFPKPLVHGSLRICY